MCGIARARREAGHKAEFLGEIVMSVNKSIPTPWGFIIERIEPTVDGSTWFAHADHPQYGGIGYQARTRKAAIEGFEFVWKEVSQ